MLNYPDIFKMVREDLNQFDFADSPIDKYADHCKSHYLQMAAKLADDYYQIVWAACDSPSPEEELQDFIHGLSHCFMWGIAAGQNIERNV